MDPELCIQSLSCRDRSMIFCKNQNHKTLIVTKTCILIRKLMIPPQKNSECPESVQTSHIKPQSLSHMFAAVCLTNTETLHLPSPLSLCCITVVSLRELLRQAESAEDIFSLRKTKQVAHFLSSLSSIHSKKKTCMQEEIQNHRTQICVKCCLYS